MFHRQVLHAVILLVATALPLAARAQEAGQPPTQTGAAATVAKPAWPRSLRIGSDTLKLYPPTADAFADDRLSGTMAFALGPTSGAPSYGRAAFTARARMDAVTGQVRIWRIRMADVEIPLAPDRADAVRRMLERHWRDRGLRLPAALVAADIAHANAPAAAVNTTPPTIVFAEGPTLLVPVAGAPDWRGIESVAGFQRAINTQALLLKDVDQALHLQAAGTWYEAASLAGPWVPSAQVPPDVLSAATVARAQQPADPLLPPSGQAPASAPAILVATSPTELIQSDGPPKTGPVAGTQLATWDNADHAVFVTPGKSAVYVLISGRWFTAPSTGGPWTYVAPDALPADFARISPTDPKANVLISVAGTPQALNAAIAASLPQTATVPLAATTTVSYEGAPRFVPIPGTQLAYAENTASPVIRVAPGQVYSVSNGVWFSAAAPEGPWQVATRVPEAIYAIPPASPVHYVTGVRIYGTTDGAVLTGYTPAYMGVLRGPGGTLVYGSGYSTPGYAGARWIAPPVTYGVGAGFALGPRGFGYGFSPGWSWGPGLPPAWGPYAGATPYGRGWGFADVGAVNIYGRWGGGIAVGGGWDGGIGVSAWSHGAWGGVGVGIGGAGLGFGGFSAYGGRYMSDNVNIHVNSTTINNHTTINKNGGNRPDPHPAPRPTPHPDPHPNPAHTPKGGGQDGHKGQPDIHQGPGPAEPSKDGTSGRGSTPAEHGPASAPQNEGQRGDKGQPDTHQGPGPAEPSKDGTSGRGSTPAEHGPASAPQNEGQRGDKGQPDTHQGPGPAEPSKDGASGRGSTPAEHGPASAPQNGGQGGDKSPSDPGKEARPSPQDGTRTHIDAGGESKGGSTADRPDDASARSPDRGDTERANGDRSPDRGDGDRSDRDRRDPDHREDRDRHGDEHREHSGHRGGGGHHHAHPEGHERR
ncbi:carbohydrate-binding family V/XII [Aquabacter sp. L1I39]|uniref:carbohydrate-binding family V/XII n=1 Tax=Aquabacter sp. L1I39 TaxID=2820278 RepID=UPI001ADC8417|nr:carbohydrate-binding family V/XII [Aquabacter sp. L1I39]QTL01964.1 carbohydrate-binding family V/XII [Aquabacter sp. L1I39]